MLALTAPTRFVDTVQTCKRVSKLILQISHSRYCKHLRWATERADEDGEAFGISKRPKHIHRFSSDLPREDLPEIEFSTPDEPTMPPRPAVEPALWRAPTSTAAVHQQHPLQAAFMDRIDVDDESGAYAGADDAAEFIPVRWHVCSRPPNPWLPRHPPTPGGPSPLHPPYVLAARRN